MPRRKPEPNVVELLLTSPWPVSAIAAVLSLIAAQLVIPAMLGGNNPYTAMPVQTFRTFGTLAAFVFGLIALLKYVGERLSAGKNITSSEPSIRPPRPAVPDIPTTTRADPIEAAWCRPDTENKPTAWSYELLRDIEWKRFEELVAAYFREKGCRAETFIAGPDGGVDIKLYLPKQVTPFALVQCKAWNSQRVGVKPVRELLGVLTHAKITKGIFFTTSEFSDDAIAFAQGHSIRLIDGSAFFSGIRALEGDAQERLLEVATNGDYRTPTCARCGIKMRRVAGKSRKPDFWGCRNYPRCRHTLFAPA